MRAAIFNPYLDTLGGGERYTLTFAKALNNAGYKVDIQWKDRSIAEIIKKRFAIDMNNMNIVDDIKRGDNYDICFWLSDGSIPILKSRINLLHFQVPFTQAGGTSLLNKMKFYRIKKVICNSYFTKGFIDNEYGIDSYVLYPPVDVEKIKPMKKDNLILYVGRFSQLEQAKRHDILITQFKKLFDGGFRNWRLILTGGIEVGADRYIQKLKNMAKNYPIEFIESPDFETLKKLYGHAKFFWSASGYGVDEQKEPRRVEHFGITPVEAMAAGAIPLLFDAGGHREIIDHGQTGFLWNKKYQLLSATKKLIANPKIMKKMFDQTVEASHVYEYERFEAEILQLIES